MKSFNKILIFPLLFLACKKEPADRLSLLTRNPWTIDKYTKTIFIDHRMDTIYRIPSSDCGAYGTLHLNGDFSGKFVSKCSELYPGLWMIREDTVDLLFLPFAFPAATIKVLNKENLVLENKYVVPGTDPATNLPDTLIRVEHLYLSH